VAQNMDFGVAPLDHLAVHPDFAVAVIEWGVRCGGHAAHPVVMVVKH
jgi:hypothetical protein